MRKNAPLKKRGAGAQFRGAPLLFAPVMIRANLAGANGGVTKAANERREDHPMKLHSTLEAAAYLHSLGIPGASAFRLKQLRTEGDGPEYRKCGRFVRYEQMALGKWAASRLSEPRRSTSEAVRSFAVTE